MIYVLFLIVGTFFMGICTALSSVSPLRDKWKSRAFLFPLVWGCSVAGDMLFTNNLATWTAMVLTLTGLYFCRVRWVHLFCKKQGS